VGCWKLEEGSEGHESWIFKAGGCITSEYENQPTKPTTDRYNQPVAHIGSINWFKPVFSCTRPAGHCKIRSYSIAPSLLEGVSSSSLSNSCSFKKTVTWLEKVFAQSHPRSCTPWEADEMSDKPILQGHMTHFSITWPLTISPLVFSLCRVCPIPHTTTRGRPTVVWWRPTTEISRRKIEKLKKWSRNRCCPNKFWTRNSSLLSFITRTSRTRTFCPSKLKYSRIELEIVWIYNLSMEAYGFGYFCS